ncbi:MAG: hypothetical protein M9885_04720 [Burkholderiaceae bacterium]|nr:hypothetical protein [Burkholderiaceae bacterium]
MAMSALCAFAAGGPVPVFAAVGGGAGAPVDDLSLAPDVDIVASPRHASVLLVAGEIRPSDRDALYRVHDQLPHPRATLWWGADPAAAIGSPAVLAAERDPPPVLREIYEALLCGARRSEPSLLPDEPPVPWRGVGEHGQGGKGMMGGTPYGRPMAMTAEDLRDGLALDAYTARIGPFLPTLPPGLVLELVLQGDLVQRAAMLAPPLAARRDTRFDTRPIRNDACARALAAHRLRCVARLLTILQLAAYAQRLRRMAREIEHDRPIGCVAGLRGALRRAGVLRAIPPGLGTLDARIAEALDPGAADGDHDVRARLQRWLDEIEQLQPSATSGDAQAKEHATADVGFRFTDLLPGLEWNEAMLVIASFDPDSLRRMGAA